MNRRCHRSIEEENPPRNRSTWDAAIECGKPSYGSHTGTWGIEPGGHQQWIKDCLVARFPQDRTKSGYLRTDGKVQERYDGTCRNRMDDPAKPNGPYPDCNDPDEVQSRRPAQRAKRWQDAGILDCRITSYATLDESPLLVGDEWAPIGVS